MRSFAVALCALAASAAAQQSSPDTTKYDATVYITSTITRTNTITASSSPTGAPVNQTSTIAASHPTMAPSYAAGNSTMVAPTGSPSASAPTGSPAPGASQVPFPGAASSLSANAYLAIVAAGLGYLVL